MRVPGGSPLHLGLAVAACLAAPAAIAAGAPDAVRLAAVLPLFAFAPGLALVLLLGDRDTRTATGLVVGLSLGVTVLVAQACLVLGIWDPEVATYGLAGASLAGIIAGAALRRARRRRVVPLNAVGLESAPAPQPASPEPESVGVRR